MRPARSQKVVARTLALAEAPTEFELFVAHARFIKRVQIHYDPHERTYSAKDLRDGHQFVSAYGEGVRVTYGKRISGRPVMEFIRSKDVILNDRARFAFEIFKCVQEIDAENQS